MDKLCQVFDKVLTLDLKDEYEMASNALESLLYSIVHMRPLQNYYTGKLVGYLDKGPFKYYVIKEVGGWGSQMMMFDDKVGEWVGWLNADVIKQYT